MRDVKRFPTTTGLSWLEMSSLDHLFKGHEKIGKEYDYVIVGGWRLAAPAGWPNSSLKLG